jgi:hypothetical protein
VSIPVAARQAYAPADFLDQGFTAEVFWIMMFLHRPRGIVHEKLLVILTISFLYGIDISDRRTIVYLSIITVGWEVEMADYSFDGKRLIKKSSNQKIGEVEKDTIRSYNGAVFGQIDRTNLRDNHGKKVAEFNGKEIKDDKGKKVMAIKDIQGIIEGEAGIAMAALWYFFVKDRKEHAGVL